MALLILYADHGFFHLWMGLAIQLKRTTIVRLFVMNLEIYRKNDALL